MRPEDEPGTGVSCGRVVGGRLPDGGSWQRTRSNTVAKVARIFERCKCGVGVELDWS